ncbi:hypothetical protein D3C71_1622250 [compost metagenome]
MHAGSLGVGPTGRFYLPFAAHLAGDIVRLPAGADDAQHSGLPPVGSPASGRRAAVAVTGLVVGGAAAGAVLSGVCRAVA